MASRARKIGIAAVAAVVLAVAADARFGTFGGNASALIGAGIGVRDRVTDPADDKTIRSGSGVASTASGNPDG